MIERSRFLRPLGIALATAVVCGAPLRAQAAAAVDSSVSVSLDIADAAPAMRGPTRDAATVAVHRAAALDAAAPQPAVRGHDRGTALMIFGGAAILTGVVIGNGAGYAISVVGAVVGLYGLYQYLQ